MQGFVANLRARAVLHMDIISAIDNPSVGAYIWVTMPFCPIHRLRIVQVLRAHDKHESDSRPARRFEWCVGRRLRLDVLLV